MYIYVTTTTSTIKMPAKEESGIFTNLSGSTTINCISLPLLKMKKKFFYFMYNPEGNGCLVSPVMPVSCL